MQDRPLTVVPMLSLFSTSSNGVLILQEWMLSFVNQFGTFGIFLLIFVENVFPPIPSEAILLFGGALTVTGAMTLPGKENNNEFIVNLRVIENQSNLIDLNLNVSSEKQAQQICDNWKNNASSS